MIQIITGPSIVKAAGTKPKRIEEYVGRVNTGTSEVSIARMKSPPGWTEPAQRPDFGEYTVVLKGMLTVETKEKTYEVGENTAVFVPAGEWVRYGSPGPEGAEYISVCMPAFSPETVHREE